MDKGTIRSKPLVWVIAAVVAVALVVGGVIVAAAVGGESPDVSAQTQDAQTEQAPSNPPPVSPEQSAAPTGGTGNSGKGPAKPEKKAPLEPVESFDDLPVDEDVVSRELVEDTVCSLSSDSVTVLVAGKDGASPDFDVLRDATITLSDQVEFWRQSEDLDPRINAAIRHADRVLVHWRKAVGYRDAGEKAKAAAEIEKADRQLVAMDRAQATQLCPTAE